MKYYALRSLLNVSSFNNFEKKSFIVSSYNKTQPTDSKEKILSDVEYMICKFYWNEISIEDIVDVLYGFKHCRYKFRKKIRIPEVLITNYFTLDLFLLVSEDKQRIVLNTLLCQKKLNEYDCAKILKAYTAEILEKNNSIISLYESL